MNMLTAESSPERFLQRDVTRCAFFRLIEVQVILVRVHVWRVLNDIIHTTWTLYFHHHHHYLRVSYFHKGCHDSYDTPLTAIYRRGATQA
jgi:hypothetical protein